MRAGWLRAPHHQVVLGVTLVHLALTIPLAALLPVWIDEAYTLETTDHGLRHAVHQAVGFELQPPLYFAAMSLWRQVFGGSIFAARMFSVLCAAATILVVAGLSRRFLKGVHPGWLTAVVAFNPFLIWAAVEIRVYAWAILLSSLLLLLFHDAYLSDPPKHRSSCWLGLFAAAALYSQYYLGFLLAALGIALVVTGRWSAASRYFAVMIVVAVVFLPLAALVPSQFSEHTLTVDAAESWGATLAHVARNLQQFVFRADWPGDHYLKLALSAAMGATFLAAVVRRRRELWPSPALAVWAATAIAGIVFLCLVPWIGPNLVRERHMAAVFVPTLLSAFLLIRASATRAVAVWSCLLIAFNSVQLAVEYRPLTKRGDWMRVATTIMERELPGEPILVFWADRASPFQRHYAGVNAIVPIPRADDFRSYDLRKLALKSPDEIEQALARAASDPERIWLVTCGRREYLGVDFRWDILDEYVERRFDVLETMEFYKTTVRLLRRKLDPTRSVSGSPDPTTSTRGVM